MPRRYGQISWQDLLHQRFVGRDLVIIGPIGFGCGPIREIQIDGEEIVIELEWYATAFPKDKEWLLETSPDMLTKRFEIRDQPFFSQGCGSRSRVQIPVYGYFGRVYIQGRREKRLPKPTSSTDPPPS